MQTNAQRIAALAVQIRDSNYPDFIHLTEIYSNETLYNLVSEIEKEAGGRNLYQPYFLPLVNKTITDEADLGKLQNVGCLTKINLEHFVHSRRKGITNERSSGCKLPSSSEYNLYRPSRVNKNYYASLIVTGKRILISGNHFISKSNQNGEEENYNRCVQVSHLYNFN